MLFYHRVNPYPFSALGVVSRELTVRPEEFEEQLKHLARANYRSVTLSEFHSLLAEGKPIAPNAILITFDDGYEDNLLWAAPLLKKYGFSGVIFAVSDFIGKTTAELWPNGDPANYGKFLDASQIRTLHDCGIEFGSHTATHPLLTTLASERQEQELTESKRGLEALVKAPVLSIAYPGGDFDEVTERCTRAAGYCLAFTTIPGVNFPGTSLMSLRRTEVSASDTMAIFKLKMLGALDWLWFKEHRTLRRLIGRINHSLMPLAQRRAGSDG